MPFLKTRVLTMGQGGQWTCLIIFIFCVALMNPVMAQYSQSKVFQFLKSTYEQQDPELHDFLINELNNYIETYRYADNIAEAYFLLGKIYEAEGKFREALVLYLKILYLFPQSNHHSEWAMIVKKIVNFEQFVDEKQHEIISVSSEKESYGREQDQYYEYLKTLARLNFNEINQWFLASCQEFTRLYPADDRNDQVTLWIGDIFAAQGDYVQADMTYMKFGFMFPHSTLRPKAIYHRAMLLNRLPDKKEQAIAVFEEIVKNFPDSPYAADALFQIAHYKETVLEIYRESLHDYQKVVNHYPDHDKWIEVQFRIGEINKKELENYWAAIQAYEQVVEKDTLSQFGKKALEEIASIYKKKLKNYKKVVDTYCQLADLFPNSKEAPKRLFDAGKICENKLNDYPKAIIIFQQVLDNYPKHGEAINARRKISELKDKVKLNYYSEKNEE